MRMLYNVTYKTTEEAIRATKMFKLHQNSTLAIANGKFRVARTNEKEFAKIAAEDFDTYKTLPIIKIQRIGFKEWLGLAFKNLTFKIFKAFTIKTPEEKQFKKLTKQYRKEITPEELKKRTVDIDLKELFPF